MKLKRYFIISFLTLVFFSFVYVFIYNMNVSGEKKEYTEISVIVRGKNPNIYDTIRQGADQAAIDTKAEVSFITLSEDNSLEEQKKMLERELNNGAKAIVLSASDSFGIKEAVEKTADKIPVITMESPVESTKVKVHIGADDYAMGHSLGLAAAQKVQRKKKITILENGIYSKAVSERLRGILDELALQGLQASVVLIDDNWETSENQIKTIVKKQDTNIILVVDTTVLETTASIIQTEGLQDFYSLYGIGVTPKIASYLEKEIIDTVVAPNDFNMGYLGVMAAVDAVEKKKSRNFNQHIEFMVINRKNMYTKENERFLFPFNR